MSDAAQPTAAEVRAAAEAVKAALDRHLDAVERRSGEDDPAVYAAFNELAAAAEAYDELLYDAYDEVTPFEIPGDDSLPAYAGPDEPSALSVLIRRDYAVAEPQRLLAQAQRVADLDPDVPDLAPGSHRPGGGAGIAGGSVHAALGVLFGEYEPDEIASRHKEFGLEEGDSTLWVAALDDLAEPGEWLSAPFDQADPQRVVCRFDVSAVFDEELDDLDDDGLDDAMLVAEDDGMLGVVSDDDDIEVVEDLDDESEGGTGETDDAGGAATTGRDGARTPGAGRKGGPGTAR
ncbi:hypothetical protein [Streptomyces mobaraensis]|uniref:Uncharacterized protein n=1 Tax=Streptomyces mobaraensis TaxID=35621 RepID=A0A5N5VZN4_STRMB|nr:hypothetical protein [Streptomyces mobaraensis]KAB7834435.1 hypothetical protein FRZ00_29240 [Streptomyces mobaraensis]